MGTILSHLKPLLLDFGNTPIKKSESSLTDEYSLVHEHDRALMFMLNLSKWRAVIAGGAALQWYRGFAVGNHDIDLYFRDEDGLKACVSHLNTIGETKIVTQNAHTFSVKQGDKEWTVQAIHNTHPSIDAMFDEFDITVCRIATDGNMWWWGPQFHSDLKTGTLRFTSFRKNSLRRYIKYVNYGYTPESGLLTRLLADPVVCTDFFSSGMEDHYDNA